jgi:hypothetical protein
MLRGLIDTPKQRSWALVLLAAALGAVGMRLLSQPPPLAWLTPTWTYRLAIGLIGIAAGVLLVGCLTAFPAALVPRSLGPPEGTLAANDYVNAQNDARSTLVSALAGLLLLVTAIFTWRQLVVSQESQVTDRYIKAVELLGNADLAVRVGAVHSLGRLAHDSPKDDRSIYTLLTAYVQNHSPNAMIRPAKADESEIWRSWLQRRRCELDHPGDGSLRKCAADVQAALDVVGGHPDVLSDGLPMRPLLTDSRLPGARLGHAQLDGADLRGAHLEFMDCRTDEAPYASFERADFRGAKLMRARFGEANLREAHLEGADLTGALLKQAAVAGALYDSRTVFPAGFDPVARGMVAAPETPPLILAAATP